MRSDEYPADVALRAHATRGEGPLWDDGAQRLLWVDIDCHAVHGFDPATGADDEVDVGQPVGAVALRGCGGLVLALRDGFAILEEGRSTMVAAVEVDLPGSRLNDGKVDPGGRFWAGTMANDLSAGAGALYRLDPDLSVTTVLCGVSVSNGIDWSPDERTMYFIDSLSGGIDAFTYDRDTAAISNRRRFVDLSPSFALPDGMTVDAEGCLWVAMWGASCVRRYSPSGSLLGVVRLPASQVTSCTFGGQDLGDLYVTSARAGLTAAQIIAEPHAGDLFVARPGACGRTATRFAG